MTHLQRGAHASLKVNEAVLEWAAAGFYGAVYFKVTHAGKDLNRGSFLRGKI